MEKSSLEVTLNWQQGMSPADALKKVQIFDKRSDESEFTGIDDGTRDKTINLLLKDDKKDAVFGELLAGGGTDMYYQGSGKGVQVYIKKNQFAALGMINNINQFGFSFKDYIDFTGGTQSEGGHGGAVQIRLPSGGGSNFPDKFWSASKRIINFRSRWFELFTGI